METGLQLALIYLGPDIIEELKDSPHLPNDVHGILEIAMRTHTEPINAVQKCLTYIREAANCFLRKFFYVLHFFRIIRFFTFLPALLESCELSLASDDRARHSIR